MRSIIFRNGGSVWTDSFMVMSESPVNAIVKLRCASIGAIAMAASAAATIPRAEIRFMIILRSVVVSAFRRTRCEVRLKPDTTYEVRLKPDTTYYGVVKNA